MGLGGLGMWEMMLIFFVVLLLFGAKRLPEIGSALGKGIREFKGSVREIEREIQDPSDGRNTIARPADAPGLPEADAGADASEESGDDANDGPPRRLTTS